MGRFLRGGKTEPQIQISVWHDCHDHLPPINVKVDCENPYDCKHISHWALVVDESSLYRCDCGKIYKVSTPFGREVADFPYEWKRSYFTFVKDNKKGLVYVE